MLGQAPRVGVERSALRADPDLSAHLNNLAASFASQYSPLEFIVKALVLRLSTVEHTVGIGLDDASGPSMVERLEALENKVSNLAHNIQVCQRSFNATPPLPHLTLPRLSLPSFLPSFLPLLFTLSFHHPFLPSFLPSFPASSLFPPHTNSRASTQKKRRTFSGTLCRTLVHLPPEAAVHRALDYRRLGCRPPLGFITPQGCTTLLQD